MGCVLKKYSDLPFLYEHSSLREAAALENMSNGGGAMKRRRLPRAGDNLPTQLWAGDEFLRPIVVGL